MNNLKLVKADKKYIDQIIEYKQEFILNNDSLDGTSGLSSYHDINEWLLHLEKKENKDTVPACQVPSTQYLLVDDKDELIGMVNIRHYLNQNLENYGGHIGYSIKPSKRRFGYGSFQLKLALLKCKELALNEVLLTCDVSNIASKKIIIKNNGIFHSRINGKNEDIERYWIKL